MFLSHFERYSHMMFLEYGLERTNSLFYKFFLRMDTDSGKVRKDPGGHSSKVAKKKDEAGGSSEMTEIKTLLQGLGEKMTALGEKVSQVEARVDKVSKNAEHVQTDSDLKRPVPNAAIDNLSLITGESDHLHDLSDVDGEEEGFDFDPGLIQTVVGDCIDESLADKLSDGLIKRSSQEMSKQIMDKYPRPQNVYPLRTPAVNPEIFVKENRQKILYKDHLPRSTQDLISASLSACAGLMNDVKAKNMDRQDIYGKLADMARMLMDSHKKVSQLRREQLRPFLNKPYKGLCASNNLENDDNELLFGRDLGRSADEVAKANRMTQKLVEAPKNGRQRGRGAYAPRGRGRYSSQSRRGRFDPQAGQKRGHGSTTHSQSKFQKKD